jgi:hypothetical protein
MDPYVPPRLPYDLEIMLRLRQVKPLAEIPWPDAKQCAALQNFLARGPNVSQSESG